MEYCEDEFLQLSGIQHFCFCRRQWSLIHIENQWQENVRTIEGIRAYLEQRRRRESMAGKCKNN